MKVRPGDRKMYRSGGRGDVERTVAAKQFMDSDCDALMLCDLDQKFPVNALEQLRAHDLDLVTGHYMFRTTRHLKSIWMWSTEPQNWPYLPFIKPPTSGMHKLASTGMGCLLIKREVFEEVSHMLPPGANPFEIGKIPEIAYYQTNFGSDYRFLYFAHKLGYELWGDADVDCPHASTMWLTRDTIFKLEEAKRNLVFSLMDSVFRNAIKATGGITQNALMARFIMLENALVNVDNQQQRDAINAQKQEIEMWMGEIKRFSPAPEALEIYKQRYAWQNALPEHMMSNLRAVSLPTLGTKEDIEHAIATREGTPEGFNEEEAILERQKVRRRENASALERMNAKDQMEPSFDEDTSEETILEGDIIESFDADSP